MPRCFRHVQWVLGAALVLVASGCATAPREYAFTAPEPSSATAGCMRPMIVVQNLTREPVALYEVRRAKQTFIAEVPGGGAYTHAADPGVHYRLRAGRGHDTPMLGSNSAAGSSGQVRVERSCASA